MSAGEIVVTHETLPDSASDAAPLLAIDTSLGSVAAVSCRGQVWALHSRDPLGHAEVIGELIHRSLTAAGVDRRDLAGVVMGVGPGPFTGLRIGMSAAHGFAIGAGVPLLPLLSHEAPALEAAATARPGDTIRVVQDARRKELFVTEWRVDADRGVTLAADPRVTPREGFVDTAGDLWHDRVPGALLIAAAIARQKDGRDFASPAPVYLRDPDVRPPAPVNRGG